MPTQWILVAEHDCCRCELLICRSTLLIGTATVSSINYALACSMGYVSDTAARCMMMSMVRSPRLMWSRGLKVIATNHSLLVSR